MLKKLKQVFFEPELKENERLFRITLLVGFLVASAAALQGILLSNFVINTALSLTTVILLAVTMFLTIKLKYADYFAVFIGLVLVCVVLPLLFFGNGGIYGGASIWFVLGILYIFMMFVGKRLVFFIGVAVVTDITTYTLAYHNPDWVIRFSSKSEVYYDSLFAILVVGLAVGGIMYYQVQLLKKEQQITLQQKEKLEEISKSKDMFFASMSHEIRTPINTIMGLNEMILREENISKEIEEDAYYIQKASAKLLSLVNDILDMSQLEIECMEIVPVQYRTTELFREAVRTIEVRMEKKKLKLLVDIDENLPSVLYGDEKRIQQIVMNLLTNAVKYTEKGSISLSVTGEVIDDKNIKLKISVSDTGIGIKKEDLAHLFESFHRVDQKKNRAIEGSGLGLSIAKRLAELLNGEITVDSVYRNGSVFSVMIPQQIEDAQPIGKVEFFESTIESRKHYQKRFEAPEARILLVDDDKNNLMVTSKLLRDTKVQIDLAGSGKECLELTQMKYYHLILLDHMMPEMDGIETLAKLRKQENGMCKEVPVLALTANASAVDKVNYLSRGFDGYLTKPIDSKRLEEEVLKYLPEEVVEYKRSTEGGDNYQGFFGSASNRRRKKIIVTSDCVCDLPADYLEKYDIRLMYLYVETEKGCFQDTKEIDSDNLSRYLTTTSSKAYSISAPVEEYEAFYAEVLLDAEEVVHISLAKYAGKSYGTAVAAAKGFDHVHVIDSGAISCGEGLMVLYAAQLAKQGANFEEIKKALDKVKNKIQVSFLLPSTDILYKNGYVNALVYKVCNRLELHPIITLRKSKVCLYGVKSGRLTQARRRYIRGCFHHKKRVDCGIVYVIHVGCSVEELQNMIQEIKKYVDFKKVIIQKASVSSACNAGVGSIGIAYIEKMKNESIN